MDDNTIDSSISNSVVSAVPRVLQKNGIVSITNILVTGESDAELDTAVAAEIIQQHSPRRYPLVPRQLLVIFQQHNSPPTPLPPPALLLSVHVDGQAGTQSPSAGSRGGGLKTPAAGAGATRVRVQRRRTGHVGHGEGERGAGRRRGDFQGTRRMRCRGTRIDAVGIVEQPNVLAENWTFFDAFMGASNRWL